MKNFMIVSLSNFKFQCMVLATSYENPLENLEEIETDLKSENYEGSIIFDMLACLGDNNNRFLSCYFDGHNLDLTTLEEVKIEKSNQIRKLSRDSLISRKEYLDLTVLTNLQKKLLSSGVAI